LVKFLGYLQHVASSPGEPSVEPGTLLVSEAYSRLIENGGYPESKDALFND